MTPLIEYLSKILPKNIEAIVEKIKKSDKALDNCVCEAPKSFSILKTSTENNKNKSTTENYHHSCRPFANPEFCRISHSFV